MSPRQKSVAAWAYLPFSAGLLIAHEERGINQTFLSLKTFNMVRPHEVLSLAALDESIAALIMHSRNIAKVDSTG
jgi:hypothetical protein